MSLGRLLKRHGVSNIKALLLEQSDGDTKPVKKTFKDYMPGYVHVDIKYLPSMPGDPQKCYLFVGIDRATRWVYLETFYDKSAASAAQFLQRLVAKCPVVITKVLTDNGKEFTDRFCATGEREPTGSHAFEKVALLRVSGHAGQVLDVDVDVA